MKISERCAQNPAAVAAASAIVLLFCVLGLFRLPSQLLPGMVEMRSESNRGRGGVGLTFEVGTDMTRVMLDVVSRLNTLPPLPPDAEEPQVFGGDNFQTQNAASLLIRPTEGHSVPDIAVQYQQFIEEVVEPRLARVPGVSRVNLEGGR